MKKAFLLHEAPQNIASAIVEIHPKDGVQFTLEEVHKYLNCKKIDVAKLPSGDILLIDKEAEIKNRSLNVEATIFYGSAKTNIKGTVIICPSAMFKLPLP